MNDIHKGLLIAACIVLLVVILPLSHTLVVRKRKRAATPPPEPRVHVSRMIIHHWPCAICRKPLEDGQLVAWNENSIHRFYRHLECAVVIRITEGAGGLQTLDERVFRFEEDLDKRTAIILTREQWREWNEKL